MTRIIGWGQYYSGVPAELTTPQYTAMARNTMERSEVSIVNSIWEICTQEPVTHDNGAIQFTYANPLAKQILEQKLTKETK